MSLLSRAQEIFGKKVFREDVTFKAKLIAKNGMEVYATPVAGEPSMGTPHPAPKQGSVLRLIYTGNPAISPSTTAIDVSAYVPVGTKGIYVFGRIKTGSNTYDYLAASKTSTANYDNAVWPVQGYGGAAFQYFPISGLIYLDADRKFWIYKATGGIIDCDLWLGSYFI